MDPEQKEMIDEGHRAFRERFISAIKSNDTELQKSIRSSVQRFCKPFAHKSQFDLCTDLIIPFCKKLSIQLAGLSQESINEEDIFNASERIFYMTRGHKDDYKQGIKATSFLTDLVLKVVESRYVEKRDDFLQTMISSSPYSGTLVSPVIQLIVGLCTSMPLLLSNIMLVLLPQEVIRTTYLTNPKRSTRELLRIGGPAQFVIRYCHKTQEIGGHTFKKGDKLALFLSKANRDENQFLDPVSFNLERKNKSDLSLGKGLHSCLGAPIIRDICSIFPSEFFNTLGTFSIDKGSIEYGGTKAIWGVKKMKIRKQ